MPISPAVLSPCCASNGEDFHFEKGRASSAESVDSFGNSSSNASLSAPLDAVGLFISSDPDGAEIFVDEKFHGQYACHAETYYRVPCHRLEIRWPR